MAKTQNATVETLKPLVDQVTAALYVATTALQGAKPIVEKVDDDVVQLIASVVKVITQSCCYLLEAD
jgi:hypothetical protein